MAVAALHVFGSFSVCFGNILAAAVTVNDQRQIGSAPCFCFLDGVDDAGYLHGLRERPGNDLA